MVKYKENSATYALNSYVRKLLEANLGLKKYQGLVPIVPVAQQPEMLQSNSAFLVYGSSHHPPSELYQHRRDAVSYAVYAPSSTEVNSIVELLFDVFQRQDDAAMDANDWLGVEAQGRGYDRGIFFTSIRSTMANKAEDAPDEEGGYAMGLVMVEMNYTKDENPTLQTTNFTY